MDFLWQTCRRQSRRQVRPRPFERIIENRSRCPGYDWEVRQHAQVSPTVGPFLATNQAFKGIEMTVDQQKVASVVERVFALRRITEQTNMITTRSQNILLATLNESELAETALQLEGK